MEIWPAIDIRGGQCVRLRQGDYNRETVFGATPWEMAEHWIRRGAKRLHLVDLDGAKSGTTVNRTCIQTLLEEVNIPCEIGGGIRKEETICDYLEMGIARVIIGTLALKQPDWFRTMCLKYPNRLALGIDARNGMVATDGWLETSQTSAIELARQFEDLPIAALIYTDIAKDGMMQGANISEMKAMNDAIRLPVVASGGVSTLEDVRRLSEAGLPACIIGRALYENQIDLSDALAFETDV